MKFRVAYPCPHCGCKCEEYNRSTGYIGCPQCERPRKITRSYEVRYKSLVVMIKQGYSTPDLLRYIEIHRNING